MLVAALGSICALLGASTQPAAAADTTGSSATIFATDLPQQPAATDTAAVQLGVTFTSSVDGLLEGVRFYKTLGNTGTHVGTLWSSGGSQLASVQFTQETASGWQTARFAAPVAVRAGTTYVAAYSAPAGRYSGDEGYFLNGGTKVRAPLTATASRYVYGTGTPFPTQTYRGTNYYVDVLFTQAAAPPPAPAPPTAAFSYTPSSPAPGQAVAFDASASTCAATPCTYTWSDDGPDGVGGTDYPLGTGQTMSFTFKSAGTKYVRETVTDAAGRSAAARRDVIVQTTPTPTPTPAPTTTPTPTPTPTTTPVPTPTPTPGTCDRTATTATFAAQVSAATAGQVLCLASGNYGTWDGVSKAITVREQSGASATIGVNFTTGDQGFAIDGLTVPGGRITNGARDITIRNSAFTSHLTINGVANSNILLDGNTHLNINSPTGSPPARIHLSYSSATPSGVTIRNSLFSGGDSDGIQAGVGVNIIGNEFRELCQSGPNHTDNIQLIGAAGSVVRGNWIHGDCTTQGITAYDGVERATVEDNVVDIRRFAGIEWYSDDGSVIRHNTVVHHAAPCYGNGVCGMININRKAADPAGRNTTVVDNIATQITIDNGSTLSARHHNLVRQGAGAGDMTGIPAFSGGAGYAGFHLAGGSPGENAASDGLDVGIR